MVLQQSQPTDQRSLPVVRNTVSSAFRFSSIRIYLSEDVVRNLEGVFHRRVCRDDLQQLVVVHHDEGVHGLFQLRDSLPNTDT